MKKWITVVAWVATGLMWEVVFLAYFGNNILVWVLDHTINLL